MAPQTPVSAFKPKVRITFKDYLNKKSESGKLLMNAAKRTKYLQYLADPNANILERNLVEKKQLNAVKQKAIPEFCVKA